MLCDYRATHPATYTEPIINIRRSVLQIMGKWYGKSLFIHSLCLKFWFCLKCFNLLYFFFFACLFCCIRTLDTKSTFHGDRIFILEFLHICIIIIGTLMQIWIFLYIGVHIKTVPWKFRILNPKNFRVIYPWSL